MVVRGGRQEADAGKRETGRYALPDGPWKTYRAVTGVSVVLCSLLMLL